MSASGGAETRKATGAGELSANPSADGRGLQKAPLAGTVCAFEHPRRTGEAELAWLAGRQHRCLHRRQLLAAGVSPKGIATWLRHRRIRQLLSDVYLHGIAAPANLTLAMAAVLHLRGDGLLSGAYAAWLWGIADERPDLIETIVVGRSVRAPAGIKVRKVTALEKRDIRRRQGLPVVAPARALIEFAASATRLEAESGLAMLRRKELATEKQLCEALDRVPTNHSGAAVVRRLLKLPPGSLAVTKSKYERDLRRLCRDAELPQPTSNMMVEGKEVDLCWPAAKLIVEFDGWEWHKHKFVSDRRRDAYLQARGWTVMRFTADDVDKRPFVVIAQIAAALAFARATARDAA